MEGKTFIPVVIPVFGREDVFKTVALLRSQEYAARLRIIVIDNGNEAGLSARLAPHVQSTSQRGPAYIFESPEK